MSLTSGYQKKGLFHLPMLLYGQVSMFFLFVETMKTTSTVTPTLNTLLLGSSTYVDLPTPLKISSAAPTFMPVSLCLSSPEKTEFSQHIGTAMVSQPSIANLSWYERKENRKIEISLQPWFFACDATGE